MTWKPICLHHTLQSLLSSEGYNWLTQFRPSNLHTGIPTTIKPNWPPEDLCACCSSCSLRPLSLTHMIIFHTVTNPWDYIKLYVEYTHYSRWQFWNNRKRCVKSHLKWSPRFYRHLISWGSGAWKASNSGSGASFPLHCPLWPFLPLGLADQL